MSFIIMKIDREQTDKFFKTYESSGFISDAYMEIHGLLSFFNHAKREIDYYAMTIVNPATEKQKRDNTYRQLVWCVERLLEGVVTAERKAHSSEILERDADMIHHVCNGLRAECDGFIAKVAFLAAVGAGSIDPCSDDVFVYSSYSSVMLTAVSEDLSLPLKKKGVNR